MNDVKLYEHRTSGGALYYSVNPEGATFWDGCIMRNDGGELEIFTNRLEKLNIKLILN